MRTLCLGLVLVVSAVSAQLRRVNLLNPYRGYRLRLDDDNPYLLRRPVRALLGGRLRTYNPLGGDDDDWLRSGSLSRRSIYPMSRRLRLGDRDDDDWLSRSIARGRMASRGLRRGLLLDDDNDNWYNNVMSRGRRLARGGLLGRFRDDDNDYNLRRSPLSRNRGILGSRRLYNPFNRDDDDDNLWRSPLLRNRGSSLRPRTFYNPFDRYDDDNSWLRTGRLGVRSPLDRFRLGDDDDNRYENIFGRTALSRSLQGLRNVASPLDDDWWKSSQTTGITPIRNSFPALQNDDDDDDNWVSGLRSMYQPRLGGSLNNNDNGLSRNTVSIF